MSTLATRLGHILLNFNIYYLGAICFFGIIGNFLNILVFCQNTLKNTGCSLYFISLSIVHIIVLCVPCLSQVIFAISEFDIALHSLFWCKFFVYFIFNGIFLSRYYICLISIDRWLITSFQARIRQLSNISVIRRILVITTTIWLIFNIHSAIGFTLKDHICDISINSVYSTFYLILCLIVSFLPLFILILFTSLTLIRLFKKNLINKQASQIRFIELNEQNNGRAIPAQNRQHHRISNRNFQLIKLSLIQVSSYIIVNLPKAVHILYIFLTRNSKKSPEQLAINNFIGRMTTNLLYTHCAITFYIYTLSSITFRKEFLLVCQRFRRYVLVFIRR
ncbi:unnamed protein product [Adineta ricciae]|uniref:G-protein coupled receptors family 1 profile domain-containing protein n=1 Tax=Adineta ricciae TaxID=249248 RepID=A0A815LQD1_ADIRI|nr:unnamed protein product [Adineta ricciae]CAF1410646.1 unnamed protein product [Adineta ricciae]